MFDGSGILEESREFPSCWISVSALASFARSFGGNGSEEKGPGRRGGYYLVIHFVTNPTTGHQTTTVERKRKNLCKRRDISTATQIGTVMHCNSDSFDDQY